MSNYLHLKIIDIKEQRQDGGEITMKAICQNLDPENVNINLSKQNSETINNFRSLVGKTAMVPIRRGVYDGNPFTALDQGNIISTSNDNNLDDKQKKPFLKAS